MKSDKKGIKITIRVSQTVKDSLQSLADEERRVLSDFIRIQLEKIIQSKKDNGSQ
jgi:mRNA-degrading endonuclease RelE of RelBE toxin-antitoxin system